MPVGINQWRAGIAGRPILIIFEVPNGPAMPVAELSLCALLYFAYMYLFICSSALTLPLSLFVSFLWSHLAALAVVVKAPVASSKTPDVSLIFAKITSHTVVNLWLAFSLFIELPKLYKYIFIYSKAYSRKILCLMQHILFALLIGTALEILLVGGSTPLQPVTFMWRHSSKSWPRDQ